MRNSYLAIKVFAITQRLSNEIIWTDFTTGSAISLDPRSQHSSTIIQNKDAIL